MSELETKDESKVVVPKTMEQLQAEYNELCSLAGENQYQAEIAEAKVMQINVRLQELNQEAAKLHAEQQKQDAEAIKKAEEKRERKESMKVAE